MYVPTGPCTVAEGLPHHGRQPCVHADLLITAIFTVKRRASAALDRETAYEEVLVGVGQDEVARGALHAQVTERGSNLLAKHPLVLVLCSGHTRMVDDYCAQPRKARSVAYPCPLVGRSET
jgi:hypothetical protein